MKIKLILLVVFILFSLLFAVIKFNIFTNNTITTTFPQNEAPKILVTINKQSSNERIFKAISLKLIRTINLEQLKIYTPAGIKVLDSKSLYILDFAEPAVKKITLDKLDVQVFGKGRGKGPGELLNPTDFFVDGNENIWILDGGQNQVIKLNSKGEFEFIIKPKFLVYRIAVGKNGKIYLVTSSGEKLFQVYENNSFENSFGKIISNQQIYAILLSGKLTIDRNDNLYFATDRGDLFLSFDTNGVLRFATHTINGTELLPKPKIIKSELIALPNKFTTLDIKSDDEYVYLLNNSENKNGKNSFLDVYDLITGVYQYSIKIPFKVNSFAIFKNNLYLMDHFKVEIYKLT